MAPVVVTYPSAHQSSRGGAPIRAIVLHHTAGRDSLGWLAHNPAGVSTHILVSKLGVLYRMVPDAQAAHTVGFSNLGTYARQDGDGDSANQITLNIELENLGDGADLYPDPQVDACAFQIAEWWRAYGDLPVITHALIDTQGKTDPRGLDLRDVLRRALRWFDGVKPSRPILAEPSAALTAVRVPRGQYAAGDRDAIVSAYWRACTGVGVDPVIALAQMCHETGGLTSWWSARPRRNPAGIGVTGETRPATGPRPMPPEVWHRDGPLWRRGNVFSRWDPDAIHAHVGRLLAYAIPEGAGTDGQNALIREAMAVRPLSPALRGCAPTLAGLEGTWAVPGVGYAAKIEAWAARITGGGG